MPPPEPINVRLPDEFQRYPCPSDNSQLAGSIEVDLGTWRIDSDEVKVHLRIQCEYLPKLVRALQQIRWREKLFAYGAFDAFVVGGYEPKNPDEDDLLSDRLLPPTD